MMKNYKQNNPRWNRTKIRGTELRVGLYGCLICSIASLATYFGRDIGVQGVIDLTGFTPDGKLIWRSGLYPDFEFDRIVKGHDHEMIMEALADPDRAVILGINEAKHWVVATNYNEQNARYVVADPLGKNERDFLNQYDTVAYMAFFKRKKTI